MRLGAGRRLRESPGQGLALAHLCVLGLRPGVSSRELLTVLAPLSAVAPEDPQQVQRGIEVVQGDRGISLAASLLHKPLHLGM